MAQNASYLKANNYDKCYRKQYETQDPLLIVKQILKIGREKIVHASCVALLFLTWAFYDVFRNLFLLYTLMNCKWFI